MRSHLLDGWTWKMAWRETRHSRLKLLLFVGSIFLGVAALVAIRSFGENLAREIDEQAKTLLGADLAVRGNQPFPPEVEGLFAGWQGEQARETRLDTMVYFPRGGGSRLAEIRGLEGGFPFYGKLVTTPPGAAEAFRNRPLALVDARLMLQYEVSVGDPIRIGELTLTVAGALEKIPGEALTQTLIEPRVYLSLSELERTGLLRLGGRVSHRRYFRFSPSIDVETLLEESRPWMRDYRLRSDTVQERKDRLGRSLANLDRYLSLAGFIALLLGGIGIGSAIHIHIKQKLSTIATLRCLGSGASQSSAIYLVQVIGMGLLGALGGALLGTGIQQWLAGLLADFLPLAVSFEVSWWAIGEGVLTGVAIGVLFALLPLLAIRRVSPLLTLRFSHEVEGQMPGEPLRGLVYALMVVAVALFAVSRTGRWIHGLAFTAGMLVVFLFLLAVARLMMLLVRRYTRDSWGYVWRQGLANLYRPNNQTVVVILALGLGTFLITTLYLVRDSVLEEIAFVGSEDRPDMVLFDIQTDQRQEVLDLLRSAGLEPLQDVPIVTMRLSSINGRRVEEVAEDPTSESSRWALFREYRSTYREELSDSERLITGTLQPRVEGPGDPILVSLEEGIARDLSVSVGDALEFDVQGVPFQTRVGSIREVEWRRLQTNFFVLFPAGVLEQAPRFHVVTTRAGSAEESAALQRAVVRRFTNVSAIDLALVLETADNLLERVSLVIRSMAVFSIVTGILVLIGAVVSSRYQRAREIILLRTLGATRRQISEIVAVEYFFLGLFAALTGMILAVGCGWALTYFLFETRFELSPLPLVITPAVVMTLTLLVGTLSSRSLSRRPPLEILRVEV